MRSATFLLWALVLGVLVVLYTGAPSFSLSPGAGGDPKQENFYGLH